MGLDKVAGVFSRLFVVGFFAPAFFAIFVLSRLLSPEMLPNEYAGAKGGTQILAIGAAAVFFALLLSGLQAPIKLAWQGYPLEHLTRIPFLGFLYRAPMSRQLRRYEQLRLVRDTRPPSYARTIAAQRLDRWFPINRGGLMPTRFGNVIAAFMQYPRARYGLEGRTIWTRVELLLTDRQHDLVSSSRADVDFFLNGAVWSILVGIILAVDQALNTPVEWSLAWVYMLPFLIAYLLYRFATNAAERWGDEVRACFDLCRVALYSGAGLRAPTNREDEFATGRALNRLFLYGEHVPDELRLPPQAHAD
jgi:hypothetical protein